MKPFLISLGVLALTACSAKTQSQNQYNYDEVGQPVVIEYAEVVNTRPVEIAGHISGGNVSVPAPPGMPGGDYVSNELSSIWGTGVGAAQQAAADKKGYEYTIYTEGKITKTLVQYQDPHDVVFMPGDLVMLQSTGSFHRLLSTINLPDKLKAPHRKKIEEMEASEPPVFKDASKEKSTANPAPAAPVPATPPAGAAIVEPPAATVSPSASNPSPKQNAEPPKPQDK